MEPLSFLFHFKLFGRVWTDSVRRICHEFLSNCDRSWARPPALLSNTRIIAKLKDTYTGHQVTYVSLLDTKTHADFTEYSDLNSFIPDVNLYLAILT